MTPSLHVPQRGRAQSLGDSEEAVAVWDNQIRALPSTLGFSGPSRFALRLFRVYLPQSFAVCPFAAHSLADWACSLCSHGTYSHATGARHGPLTCASASAGCCLFMCGALRGYRELRERDWKGFYGQLVGWFQSSTFTLTLSLLQ